jgi:hypothetical protein
MLGIRRPEEEEVFRVQDWAEVHRLNRQGVPGRAIARRLDMSHTTVHRVLGLREPPRYERRRTSSLVDRRFAVWNTDRRLGSAGEAHGSHPASRSALPSRTTHSALRSSCRTNVRLDAPCSAKRPAVSPACSSPISLMKI